MIAAALCSSSLSTGEREVLLLWVHLPYKFSLNMKCYSLVTATVNIGLCCTVVMALKTNSFWMKLMQKMHFRSVLNTLPALSGHSGSR